MTAVYEKATSSLQHVVLPEGHDPRIVEGANRAIADGLANVTLLGGAEGIDISSSGLRDEYAASLYQLRKSKGMTEYQASQMLDDPLVFAAMMVRQGHADGTLAGAVTTTADTVRTAFQIIGRAEGVKLVSSMMLMVLENRETATFADCALTIEPDVEQLAAIAIASADNHRAFTGNEPRIAMLSFSTMGSAKHPFVDKVSEAVRVVSDRRPDLTIAGELQFDAAFVPSVGRTKAQGAAVQGDANVFVFPSLESGNIGYKIAQRIGGAKAIGPILQGLAKPAHDLSRGCSAQDIYDMIAITAVQAQG
jgi:phosphate acetyltransferase